MYQRILYLKRKAVPVVVAMLSVLLLFPGVYVKADRLEVISSFLLGPINYYVYILVTLLLCLYLMNEKLSISRSALYTILLTALLIIWISFSYAHATPTPYAQEKTVGIFIFYILYLLTGTFISVTDEGSSFSVAMIVFSFWVAIETLYSIVFLNFPWAATISGSYILIGRSIGFAIPLLLSALVVASSRRHKTLIGLGTGALLVIMMGTGARGPFISAVLAITAFTLVELTLNSKSQKKIFNWKSAIAIGVSVPVLMLSFFNSRVGERILNIDTDITRVQLVIESFDLWSQSPILGHGVGSYERLTATHVQYPHNIFLELLVETGFIGFGIFVLILTIAVRHIIRARIYTGNPLYSGIFALFVFMFLSTLVSFDLNDNRQLLFIIGLMCPVISRGNSK